MVEKARRSAVGEEARGDPSREWEVFVRDDGDDPLRHVGSVTAPDAEIAREQASRLFAWYAQDLWLCPAEEVRRFSTHDLAEGEEADESDEVADDTEPDDAGAGDDPEDPGVVDEDETADHDGADEPRVTEL